MSPDTHYINHHIVAQTSTLTPTGLYTYSDTLSSPTPFFRRLRIYGGMEGSKLANAFTMVVMVLLVFVSMGAAQVGAPAPAPGPVAGATSLYVPAAFAAVAAIFVWLF